MEFLNFLRIFIFLFLFILTLPISGLSVYGELFSTDWTDNAQKEDSDKKKIQKDEYFFCQ